MPFSLSKTVGVGRVNVSVYCEVSMTSRRLAQEMALQRGAMLDFQVLRDSKLGRFVPQRA